MNIAPLDRPTRDEQIIAMWNDGAKTSAIGMVFRVSDAAVSGILHRARATGLAAPRRSEGGGRSRTPEEDAAHLRFMVAWWSGEMLDTVCDPVKAEAARQALARLS